GFKGSLDSAGRVEISFDPSAVAASGDIERDLAELLIELGEAARDHRAGFVFLIDEMQFLRADEIEAICAAMHKMSQKQLPVALVGAGLPQLLGKLVAAKSYSERLFAYHQFDKLEPEAATKAVADAVEDEGESIMPEALARLLELSDRYPAFIQAYGEMTWKAALESLINLEDVETAAPDVEHMLDEQFFRVRFEKATKRERDYLAAMASLGDGPYESSVVAAAMGKEQKGVSFLRDELIKKGLVFDPDHALVDFTVPHFADYLRRRHTALMAAVPAPDNGHPRQEKG
ncbi:MAG: hypothetical protein ACRDPA_11625, partial [Solirubrobacteraceae bacterium]